MKKLLLTLVVGLGLVVGPAANVVDAGKSYSGGGKSSSSSSGSRSSSGAGRSSSVSKPPPSRPAPAPKQPAPSKPAPAPSKPAPAPKQPAPKPQAPKSSYDSGAAAAAKREQSKQNFEAATKKPSSSYKPKPTYTTASGQSRPVDASSASARRIRDNYSYDTYTSRSSRAAATFGPSYSSWGTNTIVYNDPISPFFYGWMMSSAINSSQRAEWAYHHQHEMDASRLAEMRAKDALLDAKIRELEAKGIARDASYTLNGVDPDLQYSDDYVKAVSNVDAAEAEVKAAEAELRNAERRLNDVDPRQSISQSDFSIAGFFKGLFKLVFWTVIIVAVIWVVVAFFKSFTERDSTSSY